MTDEESLANELLLVRINKLEADLKAKEEKPKVPKGELSFLLELLLNEKLSHSVREKITARVKEMEEVFARPPMQAVQHYPQMAIPQNLPAPKIINGAMQSPSTVAALARQAAAGLVGPGDAQTVTQHDQPPTPIAVSPAAQQAIHARQIAISQGISGKPEPGRTSPRKF